MLNTTGKSLARAFVGLSRLDPNFADFCIAYCQIDVESVCAHARASPFSH